MKLNNLRFCMGAIALIAVASSADASIIFNNLGPGNAFANGGRLIQGPDVHNIGDVDQSVSFTTDNKSYLLTSITISIGVTGPLPFDGRGPLDILLASDAAGLPGATLGTSTGSVTTYGDQLVTRGFAPIALQPNTTYWVIADGKGLFDGDWNFNDTGDKGNTAGRTSGFPWGLRVNDDRMGLRVEGRVTAVPEPASMAALGLGVAAMLRRRKKA